ncbi:MAG: hypothetical protein U5K33_05320 [Halofilum sp. (in: g-proteobacteria)]|nr:hypothetical protein [Halofilum sp. (in: g-proteobacteria)]
MNREEVESEETGQGAKSGSGGSGSDRDPDEGGREGSDRSAPDTADREASSD